MAEILSIRPAGNRPHRVRVSWAQEHDHDGVVYEGMTVYDSVKTFACKYFSDSELTDGVQCRAEIEGIDYIHRLLARFVWKGWTRTLIVEDTQE